MWLDLTGDQMSSTVLETVTAAYQPDPDTQATDVAALSEWLSRERGENPKVGTLQVSDGLSGDKANVWSVAGVIDCAAGKPTGLGLEVFYHPSAPGLVAIRAFTVEHIDIEPVLERFASVIAAHGVEPHVTRTRTWGLQEDLDVLIERAAKVPFGTMPEAVPVPDGPAVTCRWGVQQVLTIVERMPVGLLRGVGLRLERAMKDVAAARAHAAARQ